MGVVQVYAVVRSRPASHKPPFTYHFPHVLRFPLNFPLIVMSSSSSSEASSVVRVLYLQHYCQRECLFYFY